MPFVPQSQTAFNARRAAATQKGAALNKEQLQDLALSRAINNEFDNFAKNKDPLSFTRNMRNLGNVFNNDKLKKWTVPDYLRPIAPQAVYEQSDEGLKKVGTVPKGSKVTQKKTEKAGARLAGGLAPQEAPIVQKPTGKFTGGLFGTGLGKQPILEDAKAWNEETQHVASRIATKEDVIDLVRNRDEYIAAGVDINTLLQYIEANMLYKPTKGK